MFVAENTVEIDRPVEEVFVFVTNPHNIPRWRKNAIEALQVQEPIQAGSTFVLAENYMGRKEFGQRVVEHIPNQLHVIETPPARSGRCSASPSSRRLPAGRATTHASRCARAASCG